MGFVEMPCRSCNVHRQSFSKSHIVRPKKKSVDAFYRSDFFDIFQSDQRFNLNNQQRPRDILVMAVLTVSLFVFGYGFRGPGRINRFEGGALLAGYVGYSAYLISTVFGQ